MFTLKWVQRQLVRRVGTIASTLDERGRVETSIISLATTANAREWPTGTLYAALPDLAEMYVVRCPTTYQ